MAPGGAVRTCSLESGGAPSKSKGKGRRVKCRLRVAAARPRLPPEGEVLPPLGCLSEGARGAEDGRANQTCTKEAKDTKTAAALDQAADNVRDKAGKAGCSWVRVSSSGAGQAEPVAALATQMR